jgi:hypothetical protein
MARSVSLPVLALLAVTTAPASAAVYYVGAFAGSTPRDDATCGTGKGAAPAPHPCATLGYWNRDRRTILRSGDVVRLAPGTYRDVGPAAGDGHHCFLLDRWAKSVTYEGRTAADASLDDHESVTVDLTGVSTVGYDRDNPCQQRGIVVSRRSACEDDEFGPELDYSGFTLRDVKIAKAPLGGLELCGGSSFQSSGITLDRIRITGSPRGGTGIIGRFDNDYAARDTDCRDGGRTVKNVTIMDSEFDHNRGFPGGLQLACADGIVIQRTRVHDVCDVSDCSACPPRGTGCNDRDGINMGGAINVLVQDSEVWHVGEDGIDVGGHPGGKSHHVTIERTAAHDNPVADFKASGGRYVTIRNSFSWGRGIGFSAYHCPHHLNLHNNTFWNDERAIQLWYYVTQSSFINNVLSATSGDVVFVDRASTNAGNRWQHNVIVNRSGGDAIGEFPGQEQSVPKCDGFNADRSSHSEATDCRIGFEPPPVPCDSRAQAVTERPATAAGLAGFKSDAAAGQWFAGGGQGEQWGAAPRFVDGTRPNVQNLHLTPSDTVARDHGQSLVPAFGDYDREARPDGAAWDIGADEVRTGGTGGPPPPPPSARPAPPELLSVDPLP